MKFRSLIAAVGLFSLASSSFSLAALNREAFTITKYDLRVRLDPEQHRLEARGKITVRNDSAQPQKNIALQISSSLGWRMIRVGEKTVQFVSQPFASDIDHTGALSEAIVTLPSEAKPKDSIELEIGYEGVIPLDMTRLTRVGIPENIAKHSSWDQIGWSFTAVRGAGYVAWYPITTESADFSEGNSLFEVTNRWKAREAGSEFHASFEWPSGEGEPASALLCAGQSSAGVAKDNSRPGAKAPSVSVADCGWKELGLVSPSFVLADYKVSTRGPLGVFALAGDEAGAHTYMEALEPANKFVTEWFGKPTAPIAIADLADSRAAPFESGTLLMVSLNEDDTKLAGSNLVHELVHSALSSPRPWIAEGLAHFAEALYREQQGGRQAALDLLGLHRGAFLDSEKDVTPSHGGEALLTTFDETYYRSKAAYVWWMLRDMISPAALKEAIGNYRAGDDSDPKYMERLLEAASKRDLGWFFDDWVYHDRGLPDFRVQSAHPWQGSNDKGAQEVPMVTITLENLGAAGAEVPFTVRCETSEASGRVEIRAKSTATTRMQLACAPVEVVVNDGSVPESDLTNNVFKVPAP